MLPAAQKAASVFLHKRYTDLHWKAEQFLNIAAPNKSIVPTLKNRSDFLRLRSGHYCHTPYFILQARKRQGETISGPRVGYTVTTKVGNAVVRNRIKRRLRAVVSEVFPAKARTTHDYVLIAKRPALSGDFAALANDLAKALDRVHGNRANGGKDAQKSKKPTGTSNG